LSRDDTPGKITAAQKREEALAKALRENLKRRKAAASGAPARKSPGQTSGE